jgi:enediyne biosynthesis protein E4
LLLQLQGTKSNRNAVGARVTLKAGGLTQVQEVYAGDSYLSHSDWRLHFGVGNAKTIDEIEIRWPSGKTEKKTKQAVNQVLKLTE